ncbi:unnamed protein product, partial [Amoebophrya sp. A25]|eukprot:GSA25T00002139001.1
MNDDNYVAIEDKVESEGMEGDAAPFLWRSLVPRFILTLIGAFCGGLWSYRTSDGNSTTDSDCDGHASSG